MAEEFEIGVGDSTSATEVQADQTQTTSTDQGEDQSTIQASSDQTAELEELRRQNASYQEQVQRQMAENMGYKNELASFRIDQR